MNLSPPPHRVLERPRRTSPLGLRFIDVATRAFVGSGLQIEAWPRNRPHERVTAVCTRSGAYAFHDLPGLSQFEYSDREDPWIPNLARRPFVVEVRDLLDRFLPFRLEVAAPVRGFFTLPCGDLLGTPASPPTAESGALPLFSTPTRSVPGGFAVLRTQLLLGRHPSKPAAGALAKVTVSVPRRPSVIRHGLADAEGRLAVIFPYPEPAGFNLGSPPGGLLLTEQRWTVQFRVHYPFEASPPADSPLPRDVPDLASVLGLLGGPEANVETGSSPPAPFREATLEFGRELIVPELHDTRPGPNDSQPRALFITPAE